MKKIAKSFFVVLCSSFLLAACTSKPSTSSSSGSSSGSSSSSSTSTSGSSVTSSSSSSTVTDGVETYTSFPLARINELLGLEGVIPSYDAPSYSLVYQLEAADPYVEVYSTISATASATAYSSVLTAAGFMVYDEFLETDGIYAAEDVGETCWLQYGEDTENNVFFLDIFLGGGGSGEETGDTYETFEEAILAVQLELGVEFTIPSYSAPSYDVASYFGIVFIISPDDAAKTLETTYLAAVKAASIVVDETQYEEIGYSFSIEEVGLDIVFYSDGKDFILQFAVNPYETSTTFPLAFIQETLGVEETLPAYEATNYSYMYDELYDCVEINSDDLTIEIETTYTDILKEAGFSIDNSQYEEYGYFADNGVYGIQYYFYADTFTVYVYLSEGPVVEGDFELTAASFPTAYAETTITVAGIDLAIYNTATYNGNPYFQMKKGTGDEASYVYNKTALAPLTSIVITMNEKTNATPSLYVGNAENPAGTALTPTISGSVLTFTMLEGATFFRLEGSTGAAYILSVSFVYAPAE